MWKDAWWLATKELKYNWPAIIFTLLAVVLFAFMSASFLEQAVRKLFTGEETFYNWVGLDIFFIGLTPSFAAIFISGPYLNFATIKEDPFSKRMAFYRALPISIDTLALSRTLVMLVTLLVMSVAYYSTIAIILSETFYSFISPGEFIMFVLFWFGYSLALGGMNTYVEFGTNGKVLFILPWFIILLFALIIFTFYMNMGQGIVEWSITLIKGQGWYPASMALVVGFIGSYLWHSSLARRLLKRDYV